MEWYNAAHGKEIPEELSTVSEVRPHQEHEVKDVLLLRWQRTGQHGAAGNASSPPL